MEKEAKARILINDLFPGSDWRLFDDRTDSAINALDDWREVIPEYVKDYVSLNAFASQENPSRTT